MVNLQWRLSSQVVAIIDLLLSIFVAVVGMIVAMMHGTTAYKAINEHEHNPDYEKIPRREINIIVLLFGIGLIIGFTICMTGIWAAEMLKEATKKGADHLDAVRKARFWRRVSIVFLILNLIVYLFKSFFTCITSVEIYRLCELVFRVISLFIVSRFILELDEVIEMSKEVINLENIEVNR